MARRAVCEQVGGYDDEMGGFADLDYCLRVTAAGYRVVFTPRARLRDDSSSHSTGADAQDADRLQRRCADRIARDPYYNSNLTRDSPDYEPQLSVHGEH